MYKILRQKVASSVTNVDSPEHFEWKKWLREPSTESLAIEKIFSTLYDSNDLNERIASPPLKHFEIKAKKPELFNRSNKYIIPKAKSNKIFFKPAIPSNKSISLNDPNNGKVIFSLFVERKSSVSYLNIKEKDSILKTMKISASVNSFDLEPFNKTSVKKLKNKIAIDAPKTLEYLKSIETKIHIINILTLAEETIEESKTETKDISIDFLKAANVHKVKILDSNKVPTYFLKNIKFLKTKISRNYFSLIGEAEIIEQLIPNKSDDPEYGFEQEKIDIEEKIPKMQDEEQFNVDSIIAEIVDEEQVNFEDIKIITGEDTFNLKEIEPITPDEKIPGIDETKENIDSDETPGKPINTTESTENYQKIFNGEDIGAINSEEGSLIDNQLLNDLIDSTSERESANENEILNENTPENIEFNALEKINFMDLFDESEEYLYDFQKEGVKDLLQNRYSLLANELGIGKTYQAAAALKILFKQDVIKTALIICNQNDTGNLNISKKTNEPNGWLGHLDKLLKDKTINIIQDEKKDRASLWNKPDPILIISSEDFLKDLTEGNLERNILENIDCVIFDEVQEILKGKILIKNFIQASNPKYVWFISSQPADSISKELETFQNSSITINEISKTKIELIDSLPKTVRQDIWFEMDDEQKTEYENTLNLGKERISKLLQTGNPFLIQSNVFTLFHQLKQICNFASSKKTSAKTDYLLNQIETIISNKKKVLIFSQYDKLGTHMLEELFKERKIKFISYNSGMSLKELDNAKKSFRKSRTIHVLINGIKTTRSTVNLAEVPYAIYFDQWWNPASVWKTEEYINNPEKEHFKIEETLNIYNYFIKDSIEEKIKTVLCRKGLLRKDIIEMLPPETINEIITTDEWLEVLGIKENDNSNIESRLKKIDELPIKDLAKKVELLFSRMGYRNVTIEKSKREFEYDLVGTSIQNNNKIKITGKCLFRDGFSDKDLKEFIHKLQSNKTSGKGLIIHFDDITEETISSSGKNISFINKELLTNYLINFTMI